VDTGMKTKSGTLVPAGVEIEDDFLNRLIRSRRVFPVHYRLRRVLAEHRITALDLDSRNVSIRLNGRFQANLSFKSSLLQDRRILGLHRHHYLAVYFRRILGRDRGRAAENYAQHDR